MTPSTAMFFSANKLQSASSMWASAVVLSVFGNLAHAQGPTIVGEATMVIGVARLLGSDGSTRVVERGTPIRVGERIQTQPGSHVHLRFVDGGRLSIRPSSRLQVEDYSHSEQQPVLGAIKFRLDEGVVRSITGTWGEAARDRFRLNTPVAAIGVKGTDFVVKSEGEKTTASVYTGAISFTPLSGACTKSVGPCLNGFEKILSEDMKGQMVELSRRQATPQLVPLIDLLVRNNKTPAPIAGNEIADARVEKPLKIETAQDESRGAKTLIIDNQAALIAAAPGLATPFPVLSMPITSLVIAAAEVGPPQVKQLFWGRYIWAQTMDDDNFTRNLGEALALPNQEKLAGSGNYLFFRPSPTAITSAVLTSPDAAVDFRLANSTAQLAFANGKSSESVGVNDGNLRVDFTRSTFATRLSLSSKTLGTDAIVASGNITPGGVLQAVTSNAAISGALSLDGKEAGYAFDKAVSAGVLRGATLWGR